VFLRKPIHVVLRGNRPAASNPGDDADAQTHANIGLDDIRVSGRKDHIRPQPFRSKRTLHQGVTAETEDIAHQRIPGDVLQGQLATELFQFVSFRNQNLAVPAVAGNHQQFAELRAIASGDREVDGVVANETCNLLRCALVQVQVYARIACPEFLHDPGQDVARLGMCGRNRKRALLFLKILVGEAPDALDLVHDYPGTFDDPVAGVRYAVEALSLAREQLQAQFFLEQLELFADARLRRIHAIRGRGDIEAVVNDSEQILELL
jgi:hypothetical protein